MKEPSNGFPDPVLNLIRVKGMGMIPEVLPNGAITIPTGTGTCTVEPPLNQEDLGDPHGRSQPVWLRIEVDDLDFPATRVQVTGTVTWDCDATTGICDHVCTVTDDDPDLTLVGIMGIWGIIGHHYPYYVDIFRAGSESSP